MQAQAPAERSGGARAENEPAGARLRVEGLSLEEYCAIRSAVWAAGDDRRPVLKRYQLTELKWRLIERRWAQHLDTIPSDALPSMLQGLKPRAGLR